MANTNVRQLAIVQSLTQRRINDAEQQFRLAQKHLLDNQAKLSAIEQYKVDYLHQVQQQGCRGLSAQALTQHNNFMSKLDMACQQQLQVISQATLVADQRKQQWLQEKQKGQAIDLMVEKRQQQAALIAAKKEQAEFDEISQRLYYKKNNLI